MKNKNFFFALALALLFANLVGGQEQIGPQPKKARTPADYKLRTLKEIRAQSAAIVLEQAGAATTLVHGDLLPSRVRLVYKGSTRPLTPERKDVISQWSQRFAGNPEHYTAPYTTEALFSERGVDHWLVVRSASLSEFRKNLKRGRTVDLYLIRMGAFKTRGKWNWVLLVENFSPAK